MHENGTTCYKGPDYPELEAMYQQGQLDIWRGLLKRFISSSKKQIYTHRQELEQRINKPISLDAAVRLFITGKGSINFIAYMHAQQEEISREIWIVHEHDSNPTDDEIASNWIHDYAEMFREYHLRSVLYLYDKEKEDFLELLE